MCSADLTELVRTRERTVPWRARARNGVAVRLAARAIRSVSSISSNDTAGEARPPIGHAGPLVEGTIPIARLPWVCPEV